METKLTKWELKIIRDRIRRDMSLEEALIGCYWSWENEEDRILTDIKQLSFIDYKKIYKEI